MSNVYMVAVMTCAAPAQQQCRFPSSHLCTCTRPLILRTRARVPCRLCRLPVPHHRVCLCVLDSPWMSLVPTRPTHLRAPCPAQPRPAETLNRRTKVPAKTARTTCVWTSPGSENPLLSFFLFFIFVDSLFFFSL